MKGTGMPTRFEVTRAQVISPGYVIAHIRKVTKPKRNRIPLRVLSARENEGVLEISDAINLISNQHLRAELFVVNGGEGWIEYL